jgi:hypothetical protein
MEHFPWLCYFYSHLMWRSPLVNNHGCMALPIFSPRCRFRDPGDLVLAAARPEPETGDDVIDLGKWMENPRRVRRVPWKIGISSHFIWANRWKLVFFLWMIGCKHWCEAARCFGNEQWIFIHIAHNVISSLFFGSSEHSVPVLQNWINSIVDHRSLNKTDRIGGVSHTLSLLHIW